ncbi:MAG: sugar transferase [bacterium]
MEYKIDQTTYRNISEYGRILSDIIVFILSFFLVYFIRESFFISKTLQPTSFYIFQLPVLLFIFILLFKVYGLYDEVFYISKLREIYFIFRSILWWTLFLVLYFYIFQISFSRIIFIIWIPVFFLFSVVSRMLIKNFQAKIVNKNKLKTIIGIIGNKEKVEKFISVLEKYSYLGFCADFCHIYTNDIKISKEHEAEKIFSKIEKSDVDEIFIVDEDLTYDIILDLIYKVSNKKIVFRISTNIFKLATGNFDNESLGEIPTLDLRKAKPSFFYLFIKRLTDIILGTFFLVIFLVPILIIALIIKVTSPGPVFIKQERVGYMGKNFFMYKFRTMNKDTALYEKAPNTKDDNRITHFGRILRKTSLDEIPQFLNVVMGEMSLVGPRPEMPFIVEGYKPWQKKRLETKPGVTGLWQILGRKDIVLADNLEYDFYYINNQSILFDFIILAKTAPVVFLSKGAY